MIDENNLKLKLVYILGLRDVVLSEIKDKTNFVIFNEGKDSFYLNYADDFKEINKLKTVAKAYLVSRNTKYNPLYISNHKSVLGKLIEIIFSKNEKSVFNAFKINCAGSDSNEVLEIKEYISNEFKIDESEEADLKISLKTKKSS